MEAPWLMNRLAFGCLRQDPGSPSSSRLEVTLYPMDLLQPNRTKSMASPVSDGSEPVTSWCASRERRCMNARVSDWTVHLSAGPEWAWHIAGGSGLNSLNHLKKYSRGGGQK